MALTEAPPNAAIRSLGDAGVLVELGRTVDLEANARARALASALRRRLAGDGCFGSAVVGVASVLVPIDAARIAPGQATRVVRRLVAAVGAGASDDDAAAEPPLEIPVRYGGGDGPDLEWVAGQLGLAPSAVVDLHASATYRALCIGFVPGFAYLGVVPAALRLPRRTAPRTRVPAGSVAIAADMTAVYPAATPGGWHVIGRTDVPVWSPALDPPARIAVGRRVRFRPA